MRHLKKIISACLLALALVITVTLIAPKPQAATYGNLTYNVSNGQVTITGCNTSTYGNLVIPDTIEGYPVTTIGWRAFYRCQYPTGITIPDSVTSIGNGAFYDCSSLENITIGDSVTSIGYEAFKNCSRLQSITIPDSVTSIGEDAFRSCTRLQSVTIGDGVTNIGSHAFYNCPSLNYNIYNCAKYLGNANNPYYALISATSTNITKCTIEGSAKVIGSDAFQFCDSLQSITIPDSVTSIGEWTFDRCTSLQSVTIGSSVTTIGEYAFYGCSSLTSITIPDSVTTIGEDAFRGCSGLTSITIPDSVTSIGERVFYDCDSLQSVIIGSSVTSIGEAFYNCSSLQSVTIGSSVTSIDINAFWYCTSLQSVYYAGTQAQWEKISIGGGNSKLTDATIYYNHIHDYTLIPPVTVAPTCTEAGYMEYTCLYGDTYWESIPALGHSEGEDAVIIPPTCTEQGYTQFTCTHCTEEEKTDYVDALGHDFSGEQTVVVSCTEQGYTETKCTRCDVTEKSNYTDAAGHIGVAIQLRDATCTEQGVTKVGTMCDRCKTVFVQPTYSPALGHSFVNYISNDDATCTEDGTKTAKCERCEITDTVADTNSAKGHDYVDGTCSRCQEVDPDYNANPGDLTGDNQTNNEDVVLLLWHTLFPEDYSLGVSGDINKDGEVNNGDVVLLLWHTLFPEDYPL